MPNFTLWLAAGANNIQPTGDPLAHHLFMRCLFHAKHDPTLKFDVKTIRINKMSDDFKQTGLRRVPGIHCEDNEIFETEDDILDFLEWFPPKRPDDEDAENSTCDLFIKFARFIKDVEQTETNLNSELLRLDNYLSEQKTQFLCSNELTQIDCLVLPRLHSIRIAAKALKNYDFPSELTFVENYLRNGYNEEIFRLSCPSDQEIIIHWLDRTDNSHLSVKERAKLLRDPPSYTLTI